jgi:hypothetical protein
MDNPVYAGGAEGATCRNPAVAVAAGRCRLPGASTTPTGRQVNALRQGRLAWRTGHHMPHGFLACMFRAARFPGSASPLLPLDTRQSGAIYVQQSSGIRGKTSATAF